MSPRGKLYKSNLRPFVPDYKSVAMKLFRNLILSVLLTVFAIVQSLSQQITKAEYFIGSDPGVGNGIDIPVTQSDSIDVSFIAETASLEPGSYSICIRFKDENGIWSQTNYRNLYIEPEHNTGKIVKAEYFIGTDPGVGNGIDIPIPQSDTIDITFNADISTFEPGNYSICTRFMDENGIWSQTNYRNLYIEPEHKTGKIIAIEYFYDNDPGVGLGNYIPIENSDSLDISLDIPVPSDLPFGEHRLYVRTQSEDSLWSTYISHYLTVCDNYGPLAGFDFVLSSGRWVAFEDKSVNSTSWLWDFGDGQTDTVQNPLHHYELPGSYQVIQYATNDCGTDTLETEVIIRGILSVESNIGANTGSALIEIAGFGFTPNSEVQLVKDGVSTVTADTVEFVSDELLRVRFDLQEKETGFRDLHLILPGDTTFVVYDGFEIVEGSPPDMQVSVSGRSTILINRDYAYNITVQNHGYEDAVGIPFVIRGIPESAQIKIDELHTIDFWSNPFYGDVTGYVLSNDLDSTLVDYKFYNAQDTASGYAFVIPYIPANNSLSFTVKLHLSETGSVAPEYMVAPQGYLTSSSLLLSNAIAEPLNCRSGEFISAIEMALDTTIDATTWEACFDAANTNALEHIRQVGMASNPAENLISYQALNGVILKDILLCLFGSDPDTSDFINIMTLLNERFNTLDLIFEDPGDCDALSFGNQFSYFGWNEIMNPEKAESSFIGQIFNPVFSPGMKNVVDNINHCFGCMSIDKTTGVTSMDPNEKTGPGNNPNDNFLNDALTLNYSIHFENLNTATSPAVQVMIKDTLDIEKYNMSTFEFGSFGFGNSVFTGTVANNEMLAVYDLRPARPCYLKMEASIDTLTGFAQWQFSSLDTLSLQLTDDPDAGFLLSNVNHPEGEGYVGFSIKLKDSLTSGDLIANDAEITFDYNDPIVTNEWINIFDGDLPESAVQDLPDTVFYETFSVGWSGYDLTSGVKYYDVAVSTIEGADTTTAIWQYRTSETTADFTGQFGETYYFYSLATDSAGNSEPAVSAFDAQVLLYNPCWDSIVVNHEYEICQGDSVNIQGTWQNEAGIYLDTLSSVYGCDSIIISQLNVLPLPEQPVISWDGTTLTSTPADTYQWYVDGEVIDGATAQTYIPSISGMYQVEITDGNICTVLSEGFEVTVTAVVNTKILEKVKVFPNPATGIIHIENLPCSRVKIELYSIYGNLIRKLDVTGRRIKIDTDMLNKGIYYLKIYSENQFKDEKIIVN